MLRLRLRLATLGFLGLVSAPLLLACPAVAQTLPASKRIALVIGNSGYVNISDLSNPRHDASDFAAKLKGLRFEVLLAIDATHAKMSELLKEFTAKVTREHVALVFYAGHGVTVNRESFLLPVDTPDSIEVDDKGELKGDAVNRAMLSMAAVLAPLEAARLGIVFLDACRTNAVDAGLGMTVRLVSFGGQSRNLPVIRGTASMDIKPSPYSAGVFRAYATQVNNVASDGEGRNSPFTRALLKHIDTRGITIQELMIRVRKSVMEETKNQQIPWEEAALNESFSFVEAPVAAVRPGPAPAAKTGAPTAAPKGSAGAPLGTGF